MTFDLIHPVGPKTSTPLLPGPAGSVSASASDDHDDDDDDDMGQGSKFDLPLYTFST